MFKTCIALQRGSSCTFMVMKRRISKVTKEQVGMIYSMWAGMETQRDSLQEPDKLRLENELQFNGFHKGTQEAAYAEKLTAENGDYCQFNGRASNGAPDSFRRSMVLRRAYDTILHKRMFNAEDLTFLARAYQEG